ncbi:MAG: DUF1559 domain-containing protein [Verrucomicrobia bacterium]|nr:DUF1559 domain-containing protein [Verrucomicrobiota bacterium]
MNLFEAGRAQPPEPPLDGARRQLASGPATVLARRVHGFTLLELLVVVVILGVLAALVLPALARAKALARRTQCLNNLKQWSTAFFMYKDDHDEFIPREGHMRDGRVRQDNWGQVQDPNNGDVWYNALPPYLSMPPASHYASSPKRTLFYDHDLFHCPCAIFPPYKDKDSDAFFSITMNSKLIHKNNLRQPQASIPFTLIQNPADTVLFLDARVSLAEPKVHPAQFDTYLGQPSASPSRFAARHSGGGNLAFCNGNVAWFRGEDVVETRLLRRVGQAVFPDGQFFWCADPLDNPSADD